MVRCPMCSTEISYIIFKTEIESTEKCYWQENLFITEAPNYIRKQYHYRCPICNEIIFNEESFVIEDEKIRNLLLVT